MPGNFGRITYNEANHFTRVLFQLGKDVVPQELNELQDALRVMLYRTMLAGTQRSGAQTTLNPGTNDGGYAVTATSTPSTSVNLGIGTIFCDGIPLHNAALLPYTPTAYASTPRTDVIYLQLQEVEVADPNQIPQLGETTRRTQLQGSILTSVTGLGGVPSNSTADIWQGGIHYFPLASINRNASVITQSMITDLRSLLPPSLMAQITRQGLGLVDALKASVIETPPGGTGEQPLANSMTFDLDPTAAVALPAELLDRYGRDSGSPSTVFHANVESDLPGGLVGQVATGPNVAFASDVGPVKFRDANMVEAFVPLSDTLSGTGVRVGEIVANESVLQAINARFTVTCGDGVSTFGDFNGPDALSLALAATASVTSAVRILLKSGTYTIYNGVNFDGIIRQDDLTIEGLSPTSTTLTWSGSIVTPFTPKAGGSGLITFRNVAIKVPSASSLTVPLIGLVAGVPHGTGKLTLDNCALTNVTLGLVNPGGLLIRRTTAIITNSTAGGAFCSMAWGSGSTNTVFNGEFVVEDSSITMTPTANGGAIFYFGSSNGSDTATAVIRQFIARRSTFSVGGTPVTGSTGVYSYPAYTLGATTLVADFFDNARFTYKKITFQECIFTTTTATGTQFIWMHMNQTNTVFGNVEFLSTTFDPNGNNFAHVSPMAFLGAGGAPLYNMAKVTFFDCTLHSIALDSGVDLTMRAAGDTTFSMYGVLALGAVMVEVRDLFVDNVYGYDLVPVLSTHFNTGIDIDGVRISGSNAVRSGVTTTFARQGLLSIACAGISSGTSELAPRRIARVSTNYQPNDPTIAARPTGGLLVEKSCLQVNNPVAGTVSPITLVGNGAIQNAGLYIKDCSIEGLIFNISGAMNDTRVEGCKLYVQTQVNMDPFGGGNITFTDCVMYPGYVYAEALTMYVGSGYSRIALIGCTIYGTATGLGQPSAQLTLQATVSLGAHPLIVKGCTFIGGSTNVAGLDIALVGNSTALFQQMLGIETAYAGAGSTGSYSNASLMLHNSGYLRWTT